MTNNWKVMPGIASTVAATVIATVAVTGCSNNTSGTRATSTAATSTSAGSPAPPATASAPFVGQWHVHGAQMDIAPTTVTEIAHYGAGSCRNGPAPQNATGETDTMAIVSASDKKLELKVTGVSFSLCNGQTSPVNPDGDPHTAVGDEVELTWEAPGLLKEKVLHGFDGPGNPYWCGTGISDSDRQHCGA